MLYDTEERRVRKTKRAIRNAFAALLAEKDVNQITVKDIASNCGISTRTFYHHFDNRDNLIAWLTTTVIDGALSQIDAGGTYYDLVLTCYQAMEERCGLLRSVFMEMTSEKK